MTDCELMQLNVTRAFLGSRGKGERDKGLWAGVSQVQLNSGSLLLIRGTSQGAEVSVGRQLGRLGESATKSATSSPVPARALGRVLIWLKRYDARNLGQI